MKYAEFLMDDLFYKLDLKCLIKKFDKSRDISRERSTEFNLPLVNAKHGNNGIMYYGKESDYESAEMTIDIVSDGASSTGDVYAQPQRTGVLYNAYLIKLKAKEESLYVLLFLSCVIQKTIKKKFGYDNKCGWEKVKQLEIKLPVDETGNPDFAYMESYMRNRESAVSSSLTALRSALR